MYTVKESWVRLIVASPAGPRVCRLLSICCSSAVLLLLCPQSGEISDFATLKSEVRPMQITPRYHW